MISITISADTTEQAVKEGLHQLGVPFNALEVETLSSAHDEILPGAEPLPGVTVRLTVKEDVLIASAREHLRNILKLTGVNAEVEVLRRRGGAMLNIHAGGDGPLIIGRSGQNLEAYQIMVNRMVVHGGRDLVPLYVDCEGYLEKRLSRLESQARRASTLALREGSEVALEPMSSFERKIIHNTMKEMRGVHTLSRGEGLERHIVICPGEETFAVQDRRRLKPHPGGRRGQATPSETLVEETAGEDFD